MEGGYEIKSFIIALLILIVVIGGTIVNSFYLEAQYHQWNELLSQTSDSPSGQNAEIADRLWQEFSAQQTYLYFVILRDEMNELALNLQALRIYSADGNDLSSYLSAHSAASGTIEGLLRSEKIGNRL